MEEDDSESGESSDSSCSSCNSIIWIGDKPNGRGSSELIDTTESTDPTESSDPIETFDPREKAGTVEATETAGISSNHETHDVSEETNDEWGTTEVISENSESEDASVANDKREATEVISGNSETDDGSNTETDDASDTNDNCEVFEASKSTDAYETMDEMPGTSASFGIAVASSKCNTSEANEMPGTSSSFGVGACSESECSDCDSDDSNDTVYNVYTNATKLTKMSKESSSFEPADPNAFWKTFDDDDYVSDKLPEDGVELSSIKEFLIFKATLISLFNLPAKVPLEDIVNDMLENNKGAFMRIEIGSHEYQCIHSLLKVYSSWFANQKWTENNFKFDERDVPPKAFKVVYNWMRMKTTIKLKKAVKVMQVAMYLNIDLVVAECWKLFGKPNVREKVAFDLFLEAGDLQELDELRHVLLSRIRYYFLPMVGTDAFLNLTLAQVTSLLKLDTIGVNSEVEVFFAAIRWISHNSPDRLPHMKSVMECIRFSFMSMNTLFAIRDETGCQAIKDTNGVQYVLIQIRRHPDVKKMLCSALAVISGTLVVDSEDDTDVKIPRKFIQPRHWVFNPKSPYHMPRLNYPYNHDITYSDFINFIQKIQDDWLGEKPSKDSMRNVEYDSLSQKGADADDSGFLADEEED
ncbi:hypothetical protein ACLKA7_007184 [Drosophila subpalustris]